jgi:hypothetical protein
MPFSSPHSARSLQQKGGEESTDTWTTSATTIDREALLHTEYRQKTWRRISRVFGELASNWCGEGGSVLVHLTLLGLNGHDKRRVVGLGRQGVAVAANQTGEPPDGFGSLNDDKRSGLAAQRRAQRLSRST